MKGGLLLLWAPTRVVAWGVHLGRADRGGEKESPPSLVIYFLFFIYFF